MPFSSLLEFNKWLESMQRRYNSVEDRALQKKEALFNHLHGPLRPHVSPGVTKTGATLSPLCQEDLINTTTGPRHPMAKRDIQSRPSIIVSDLPSSPTIQCPDDCSSKRFCGPSSYALESVREANAIVEALRRAK